MSTSQEHSLLRQMLVIGYLIQQNRLLRMKDFEPMLQEVRAEMGWKIFPLNRTTVKSALMACIKGKLVKVERLQIGNRFYWFYKPTTQGRNTYDLWAGEKVK